LRRACPRGFVIQGACGLAHIDIDRRCK